MCICVILACFCMFLTRFCTFYTCFACVGRSQNFSKLILQKTYFPPRSSCLQAACSTKQIWIVSQNSENVFSGLNQPMQQTLNQTQILEIQATQNAAVVQSGLGLQPSKLMIPGSNPGDRTLTAPRFRFESTCASSRNCNPVGLMQIGARITIPAPFYQLENL